MSVVSTLKKMPTTKCDTGQSLRQHLFVFSDGPALPQALIQRGDHSRMRARWCVVKVLYKEPLRHLAGQQGPVQEVAQHQIAADPLQDGKLVFGLDAFGNHS